MEKANHTAAQRWWRTLADEVSPAQAQTGLDRFCVRVGDARPRRRVDGTATTVAGLAADEALRPMPTAPFPAVLSADAQISAQALVCFRGNSYSVGPGMAGTTVTVAHRLGTATLDIVSAGGVVLARHRRQPDSAGAVIRHDEHVTALEHAVLAAFTDRAPCRAKTRRPPSEAARAEAARITGAAPAAAGGVAAAGSRWARSVARSSSTSPVTSRRPRTVRNRAPPPPTGPGDDRARRVKGRWTRVGGRGRGVSAAARAPGVSEDGRCRRGAARAARSGPRATPGGLTAALERLLAVEVDAVEARRQRAGYGSPACPSPGR